MKSRLCCWLVLFFYSVSNEKVPWKFPYNLNLPKQLVTHSWPLPKLTTASFKKQSLHYWNQGKKSPD